ncbi:hypothetical protein ES705_42571 [subsurface metagenome]
MNSKEMLEQVSLEAAENCFNDHGKKNLTQRRRELEGLGIRISQSSNWRPGEIMVVCYAALEDANCHDEAGELFEKSKDVAR